MQIYSSKEIKNIALLGNDGSGKTTLTEALLFESGQIKRRGRITQQNTVSDYFPVEQEYGYSVLMGIFSAMILLYAGFAAIFKDYRILPLRVRVSVAKPKNEKKYMTQFAKMLALVALSPALSALAGLWNMAAALIVLIVSAVFFIWLGSRIMKNVE